MTKKKHHLEWIKYSKFCAHVFTHNQLSSPFERICLLLFSSLIYIILYCQSHITRSCCTYWKNNLSLSAFIYLCWPPWPKWLNISIFIYLVRISLHNIKKIWEFLTKNWARFRFSSENINVRCPFVSFGVLVVYLNPRQFCLCHSYFLKRQIRLK